MDSMSELSSLVKQIDEEVRKGMTAIEAMKTLSETVSDSNQQVIQNLCQGRSVIDALKAVIVPEYRLRPITRASEVLKDEAQTMVKYFKEMIEMYERLKSPVEQLLKTSQAVSKPCEIQPEKVEVVSKKQDVNDMIHALKDVRDKIQAVPVNTPPVSSSNHIESSQNRARYKKNHCWPNEIPLRAEVVQQDLQFSGKTQPVEMAHSVIAVESLPVKEQVQVEMVAPKEEPKITGEPVKMITTQEASESLGVSPATIRSKLGQLIASGEIQALSVKKQGRMNIFPFEYLKKLTLTDKDRRSNNFFSMFQSIDHAALSMGMPVSEIREYINTGMTRNSVNLSIIVTHLTSWNFPEVINVEDIKVGDSFRFMTPNFTGLTINDRKVYDDGKEKQAKKNIKTIYIDDDENPLLSLAMNPSEHDKVIMEAFLATEFKAIHQKKMIMTLSYTMPEGVFANHKTGEVKFNMDVLPMYPVKVVKLS